MRIIFTILLILASLALIFLVARSLWGEIALLRNENAALSEAISKLRELRSLRDDLLATYNSIPRGSLLRLQEFLPERTESGSLLIALERMAKERGLRLRRIEFLKDQLPGGRAAAPSQAARIAKRPEAPANVLNFNLTVSASYEAFKSYLLALEKNLRLTDVLDISFAGGAGNVFEFAIRAKSYYQKESLPVSKEGPTLELVDKLKKITIDTSFFGDPAFRNLESQPKLLIDGLTKGRPSPFTPASQRR